MKVSEPKPSDPGRKDSPFPAWLLRYAAQAMPSPLTSTPLLDPEVDDEQDLTELNHFEEGETIEPAESEAPAGETTPNNQER